VRNASALTSKDAVDDSARCAQPFKVPDVCAVLMLAKQIRKISNHSGGSLKVRVPIPVSTCRVQSGFVMRNLFGQCSTCHQCK
jgi:hypothetical protein